MSVQMIQVRRRRRLMQAACAAAIVLAANAAQAVTFTDGVGDAYGPAYVDISSVDLTNDATHLTFQINLNPAANLLATDGSQRYGKYFIGFQTGNAGSTALSVPWGNPIGISSGTGMDYWIGSWADNSATPPFSGGAELYEYANGAFTRTAGNGTSNPYIDMPHTLAASAITISVPLTSLGLAAGDTFKFDVWTTFPNDSAYDALGKQTRTTDPGTPYNPVTPYDAGANLLSYTIGGATSVSGTWASTAGGNWSSAANWTGGVPNGVDHVATFGSAITAASTVTVDGAQTVGTINFDNASAYTLAGDAITLDVGTGSANVNVQSGSHNIDAAITLADDAAINVVPAGSTLKVRGTVTATGRSISKTGAGTATFANIRAAALNVQAGTVRTAPQSTAVTAAGTSVVSAITVAAGAVLDIANNGLVIDYTTLGTLPADVRAMLASGRIIASGANAQSAIGYMDNAVAPSRTTFAGVGVDASSILLAVTLKGDADLNRSVGFSDLVLLAQNYNATNATWQQGDFNYDGSVSFQDLVALAQNYNGTASLTAEFSSSFAADWALAQSLVPEPTLISVLGGLTLFVRRTRRSGCR